MNSREFGVHINLITNKFKQQANNFKQQAKNWANGIKKDLSIKPQFVTAFSKKTDYTAQIEQTQQKLNELIQRYNETETMKPFKGQQEDLKELELEIEKTTNDLNGLNEKQSKVGGSGARLFHNGIKGISNSLNKATSKIKRYALSILSLRSAYSMVSRAASSYLSVDEERSNKISDAWTSLGAVLVPIIDMITSAIQGAVYYINYFIKALTGVDYIAKAMASYSKNASKTTKEMQKNVAGFDEINDISSSSGSGASKNKHNPFSWMDEFKPNQSILDFLDKMADGAKKIWKWMKDNKTLLEEIGLVLATFWAGNKLLSFFSGFEKLFGGSGAITKGLGSVLTIVSGAAVIGFNIKKIVDDTGEITTKTSKVQSGYIVNQKKQLSNYKDIDSLCKHIYQQEKQGVDASKNAFKFQYLITGQRKNQLNSAINIVEASKNNKNALLEISKSTGTTAEDQKKIYQTLQYSYDKNKQIINALKIQGVDTKNLNKIQYEFKEAQLEVIKNMEKQGLSQDEIAKQLGISKKEIENIKNYTDVGAIFKVKADTTEATNKVNDIINLASKGAEVDIKPKTEKSAFDNIKKTFSKVFDNFAVSLGIDKKAFKSGLQGLLKSVKPIWSFLSPNISYATASKLIASLNVGTNYVPNDQLAMIHKGEAVIPKKFNSREYFGGGSEETNSLLRQLNTTLENKDMNAYISKDIVGQASVDYINYKNRTLGRSVI